MNNDTPAVPKLRAFEFFPDTGKVNVDFNMQQKLTRDMTRDGLKIEMSDHRTQTRQVSRPRHA